MAAATELSEQHRFVSDVLHHLSQPLTALHCSLELSLARDQTSGDFRVSIEAALENAERLRQRLLLLRELNDAGEPGDTSVPVPLDRLLEELREELFPLFESDGKSFEVDPRPLQVRGNRTKLARGFFCMLLFLLRQPARLVLLTARQGAAPGGHAEIAITATGFPSSGDAVRNILDTDAVSEMEIARRSFEAVGGKLQPTTSTATEITWLVQLPTAR